MDFDENGRIIIPNAPPKKKISKEELIFWKGKYDSSEKIENRNFEREIRGKLSKNKFMSKEDFIGILGWKVQGRLKGRLKRMLNVLGDYPTEKIEEFSGLAFSEEKDLDKLKLLSEIPAIKNSLASVILSFYDSENFGILDIHSWRELFGPEPKDIFSNPSQFVRFLNEVRRISKETRLTCRDVEKALFQKNLGKV
jgi:hypothetical protein